MQDGTRLYDKYTTSDDNKKYIDDYGSGFFPNQNVRKLHNAKYQKTYSNRYYVLKNNYIKDTRIRRTY